MTQDIFWLNMFFGYFFTIGDYYLILFALTNLVVIVVSLLKYFLTKD